MISFQEVIGQQTYNFEIRDGYLYLQGSKRHLTRVNDVNNWQTEWAEYLKVATDKYGNAFTLGLDQELAFVEKHKGDTPWEVYSEYNTNRGNHAFTVWSRMCGGRLNWKQEGKRHLSINSISTLEEVKAAIADINRFYKLKHVSGYNHLG